MLQAGAAALLRCSPCLKNPATSKPSRCWAACALQVPHVLRYFHAKRSEMAQFVTSLQYYIVFEVLEPAWARFMQQLPSARDLDAVISLHDGMLETITKVGWVRLGGCLHAQCCLP